MTELDPQLKQQNTLPQPPPQGLAAPAFLPPRLQDYDDYRRFLADYYQHRKSQRAGFSFRQFAAACDMKSPNYLQLVMKGDRNLSEESAVTVARAMRLSASESQYFVALVRHDNAKTDEEVRLAQRQGLAALKKIVAKNLMPQARDVLNEWYYLLVRELVFLKDFQATPSYVCQRLPGLSESQAENALHFLIATGYLRQEGSHWVAADPVLDTGDSTFQHTKLQAYHADTLEFWAKQLATMDSEHQELGLLNIPMSQDKIPELKQKMRQFQDEIIGWLQNEKAPDCVVQLGCYLMPVSLSSLSTLDTTLDKN